MCKGGETKCLMVMACEPPSKRLKHKQEYLDDIFESFHENKEAVNELRGVIDFLEGLYCGYGVCQTKIHVCNATCKKSFRQANCDIRAYTGSLDIDTNSNPKGYAISNIFEHGFEVVESYIEAAYKIPLQKGARKALSNLLTFWLTEIKNAELALRIHVSKDTSEAEWVVCLAHHLLAKLTVNSTYLINSHYPGKLSSIEKCPCGCSKKVQGCYGDTNIGVSTGWHGCVDLLFDGIAVKTVNQQIVQSHQGDEENESTIGIDIREQLRAQTIVFSFLQLKTKPELENFLVPSIAISRNKVVICFYDCENDILLETPSMDLFVGTELCRPTVFVLWLTLNYKYFCSGVSEKIQETCFTADFYKLVGKDIEKYKQYVKHPCPYPEYTDVIKLQKVENYRNRNREDVNRINDNPDLFRI